MQFRKLNICVNKCLTWCGFYVIISAEIEVFYESSSKHVYNLRRRNAGGYVALLHFYAPSAFGWPTLVFIATCSLHTTKVGSIPGEL